MSVLFTVWATTQFPSISLIAPDLKIPVEDSVTKYQKKKKK